MVSPHVGRPVPAPADGFSRAPRVAFGQPDSKEGFLVRRFLALALIASALFATGAFAANGKKSTHPKHHAKGTQHVQPLHHGSGTTHRQPAHHSTAHNKSGKAHAHKRAQV